MYSLVRKNSNIWQHLPDEERAPILGYQGFDAEHLIDAVDRYHINTNLLDQSTDLIYINEHHKNLDDERFDFIGYDCGVLKEFGDYVFFSVVVNEIRLNGNEFLKNFSKKLNTFYLFSSKEDVNAFLEARKKAIASNCLDFLETAYDSDQIDYFEIYLYKKNRF